MAKFIRKVTEVDAEQYDGSELVTGICKEPECPMHHLKAHVHTMHDNQAVKVEPGDFILPEPDGVHYYPVKPEVFYNTYDAKDDKAQAILNRRLGKGNRQYPIAEEEDQIPK